jgi:hypothetical protein
VVRVFIETSLGKKVETKKKVEFSFNLLKNEGVNFIGV